MEIFDKVSMSFKIPKGSPNLSPVRDSLESSEEDSSENATSEQSNEETEPELETSDDESQGSIALVLEEEIVDNEAMDSRTTLMKQCLSGCLADVQELLNNGADSTVQNSLGETALFLTIPTRHRESPSWNPSTMEILKLLCQNTANWNHKYDGLTPIEYAVVHSDTPVVEFLLRLDPPLLIQQEALMQDYFHHGGRKFQQFFDMNHSLDKDIPKKSFERIKEQYIQTIHGMSFTTFRSVCRAMANVLRQLEKPR